MTIPYWNRSTDIRTLGMGDGCELRWFMEHLYAGEYPEPLWFITGTAVHYSIEESILHDYDEAMTVSTALLELDLLLDQAKEVGILESAAKRPTRTLEGVEGTVEGLASQWWRDVHAQSPDRMPIYDEYDWPPRVEHQIRLPKVGLYTTVDAIFDGGPSHRPTVIVDWKTGSTTHSTEAQLHHYAYGGKHEGWMKPDDQETLGWFHHVKPERGKKPTRQVVSGYWGNKVVESQIKATRARKDFGGLPVASPDWYCGYCSVKDRCPAVNNNKDELWQEIETRLELAEGEEVPNG